MDRVFNAIAMFVVLTMLVVHFNSCENYSEDPLFQGSNDCVDGVGLNCPGDQELLQITAGPVPGISDSIFEFQVTGQCADGEFPANRIQWRILLGNQEVQNSQNANDPKYFATCVGGNYSVFVRTPCPTGAALNFGNGLCSGISANMTLQLQIVGVDGVNEYVNPDMDIGQESIGLFPQ